MNKSGHRKSLSPNVLNVKFPYQQARHSPLKIIDIFLKEKKSKEQNAYTEAEPTIVKNHRYSKLIEQFFFKRCSFSKQQQQNKKPDFLREASRLETPTFFSAKVFFQKSCIRA